MDEPTGMNSGTILIAEDEDLLRELLKMVLESEGYTILEARDGLEAVDLYARHRENVSLVVTDLGLPGLDGWGAFLRMKELNPDVRVLVASGYIDPHTRVSMLKAGARDLLQKPYIPEDILARVKNLAHGGPGTPPS
jgi:DNA-binding response OmpR family regulator